MATLQKKFPRLAIQFDRLSDRSWDLPHIDLWISRQLELQAVSNCYVESACLGLSPCISLPKGSAGRLKCPMCIWQATILELWSLGRFIECKMTHQPILGFLVPSIARRISILKGHADIDRKHIRLKIVTAQYPSFEVDLQEGEHEQASWDKDYNAAAELALTSATLRRMMLYHGALVKVSLSKGSLLTLPAAKSEIQIYVLVAIHLEMSSAWIWEILHTSKDQYCFILLTMSSADFIALIRAWMQVSHC